MKIIAGLFFIILSFLGTIFFRRYQGDIIPYPLLWYLLFLVVGLIGVWLIYSSFKTVKERMTSVETTEIQQIKTNAEKIELDFDRCEFKSGTYSHQVEDKSISYLKWIDTGSLSLGDTTVTETVHQSYLIYSHVADGKSEKYLSQSFPVDQTTLKFYVMSHYISLHIDRFDPARFFFELKKD